MSENTYSAGQILTCKHQSESWQSAEQEGALVDDFPYYAPLELRLNVKVLSFGGTVRRDRDVQC